MELISEWWHYQRFQDVRKGKIVQGELHLWDFARQVIGNEKKHYSDSGYEREDLVPVLFAWNSFVVLFLK